MDELQALIDILHDSEKNSNVKVALDMIDRNGDGKTLHMTWNQSLLFPAQYSYLHSYFVLNKNI